MVARIEPGVETERHRGFGWDPLTRIGPPPILPPAKRLFSETHPEVEHGNLRCWGLRLISPGVIGWEGKETHKPADIPGGLIAQGNWGNRQNGIQLK